MNQELDKLHKTVAKTVGYVEKLKKDLYNSQEELDEYRKKYQIILSRLEESKARIKDLLDNMPR